MPFKHTVTDSLGRVHKRISANRQYAFAIVRAYDTFTITDPQHYRYGHTTDAHSTCSWTSRLDLAQKEAAKTFDGWLTKEACGFDHVEIIPCTPIPTGRHAI